MNQHDGIRREKASRGGLLRNREAASIDLHLQAALSKQRSGGCNRLARNVRHAYQCFCFRQFLVVGVEHHLPAGAKRGAGAGHLGGDAAAAAVVQHLQSHGGKRSPGFPQRLARHVRHLHRLAILPLVGLIT